MNPREQELCNWILGQIISDQPEPDLLAGQLLELALTYSSIHVEAKNLEMLQVQIGLARSEYHQKRSGELLSPFLSWVGYLLVTPEAYQEVSESQITQVSLEELADSPQIAARGTYEIKNATSSVSVSIDMVNTDFDQHLTLHRA